MNVRALPRREVEPTLRRMLEWKPDPALAERLDHDQALLNRVPGETFGEMTDRLEWTTSGLETRSVGFRFAGIGAIYVAALGGFGAWLVHPALGVGVGVAALGACGAFLTVSMRAGREAEEKRQEHGRVRAWLTELEGCSEELQRHLDICREMEALRSGLEKPSLGAIRESPSRVDVGAIPVKKRGGLLGLIELALGVRSRDNGGCLTGPPS